MGKKLVPNKELLRQTLDHIKEHSEEWNQWYYRCGTTMCFAGHAALLSGCKWVDQEDNPNSGLVIMPNGVLQTAATAARRALGLRAHEADHLFRGWNTIEDLERIVGGLCAGPEPD